MKYVPAAVSFIVVFAFAFILGGWLLRPYLPPSFEYPVSAFQAEFWTTNWAGAVLGLILGTISAWQTLKRAKIRAPERPGATPPE